MFINPKMTSSKYLLTLLSITITSLPLISSQLVSSLPDCIQDCIEQSPDINCSTLDVACLCRASSGNFLPDTITCSSSLSSVYLPNFPPISNLTTNTHSARPMRQQPRQQPPPHPPPTSLPTSRLPHPLLRPPKCPKHRQLSRPKHHNNNHARYHIQSQTHHTNIPCAGTKCDFLSGIDAYD